MRDEETTCPICGCHVAGKDLKIGDITICFECEAEFDVTEYGLKYIINTGGTDDDRL